MWLKEKKLLNKVCPNCINSFLKSWGGYQISHLSSDVRSFFSHKKKWIGNLRVSVKWSHNHCFLLPPLSAQSHKPGSSIDTTVLRPLSKHFMSAQYPITVSSSEVTQRFQYNQGSPFFTQRGQLFCQLWRCSQQAMLHIVSCTSTLPPFTPTCDTWFWFFLFFFSPFLYFFFSLPIFFFFEEIFWIKTTSPVIMPAGISSKEWVFTEVQWANKQQPVDYGVWKHKVPETELNKTISKFMFFP